MPNPDNDAATNKKEQPMAVTLSWKNCSLSKMTYTVNHKNVGSTFVIITLENLHRFL